MGQVEQYREWIQDLLSRYRQDNDAEQGKLSDDLETQTVFDTVRAHYQIMHVGWRGKRWVHSCTVHVDVKDGKIWIQWNGMEDNLARELVELGVPKTDIVLGFHAPSLRKHTDYAAG